MKPNKIHIQAKDNRQIHICGGRLVLFGRWWKTGFIKSIIFVNELDVTNLALCLCLSRSNCGIYIIPVINRLV